MDDCELKRLLESQAAETGRYFDEVAGRQQKRLEIVNEAVLSLGEQLKNGIESLENALLCGAGNPAGESRTAAG